MSWQQAVFLVPALYRPLLEPLGASLTAGEDAELINLTKEEVRRAAAEERRQLGERGRLATALCLSAALLTIYDMCKAMDREMVLSDIHLVEKRGGRSGTFRFGGDTYA